MNIQLEIPQWLLASLQELPKAIDDVQARVQMILDLARLNLKHETGGPFAAGVFEKQTGKIVAIGVNLVVATHCSSAHAEIVAISLAQQQLRSYDLGGAGMPHHQLVVNAQPCAMCVGAIHWSGLRSVIFAATREQVEKLTGFDEGPVHPNWRKELERRGIEVESGILENEACQAFREFSSSGGLVYNSRATGS
ncbi:MAG: nucleoside deaminase [bacterium]|nr:nucleoside deaminase [bacterium]